MSPPTSTKVAPARLPSADTPELDRLLESAALAAPRERVKIDGGFVSDILTRPRSAALVRGIVSLGRDLGIATVAESAENARILERLRELAVQYAQGYGIDEPRPVSQVFAESSARQGVPDFASGSKS